MHTKIIARVKGGLGNQLFCYAAARRLALLGNAELVIDHVTGFARDHTYRRQYALDHFKIPCRKATPAEYLQPFERYRRGLAKWLAHTQPFERRRYIEQQGEDFDARLLTVKPSGVLYLDGLWQSERYFQDIEETIRDDLRMRPPTDDANLTMSRRIRQCNAVALHVRWFGTRSSIENKHSLSVSYYLRAVDKLQERVKDPHYFLFSDDPDVAGRMLSLPKSQLTIISHNAGEDKAYADLWLMSGCRYFIIANSTFSWWGAWLARHPGKLVFAPKHTFLSGNDSRFTGLMSKDWIET